MTGLTTSEGQEFGRALRFIRDARQMTLRDVLLATKTETVKGVSFQHLHNIEEGERGFDANKILQLQRAYRLPDHALEDLLLRARVRSALAQRGISAGDADAAYRMMETRLGELGTPIHTDLAALIAGILGVPA